MPTSVPACTKLPHGGALPSGFAAGAPSVDCGAGEAVHETDDEELAGADDAAGGVDAADQNVGEAGADDGTSAIGAADPDPTDVEPTDDEGVGDAGGASAMPRPLPDPDCTVCAP